MGWALRVAGMLMGVAGALVAAVFMLLGPWVSTPGPEGIYLWSSVGYPLCMLLAGIVVAARPRAGLALALLALGCALIALAPSMTDDSLPPVEAAVFGLLICSPALVLALVSWAATRMDLSTPGAGRPARRS
jgi:hypothetical protein